MAKASEDTHFSKDEISFAVLIHRVLAIFLMLGGLSLVCLLFWQGFSAGGNPNPVSPHTSSTAAWLSIAVLVFREGLECILVLAAVTVNMTGRKRAHRRPVMAGVGVGFIATLLTWFVAVGIVSDLSGSVSALNLQAATGLLAVLVLLIVMNWFFHKIYWGGWMAMHSRRKKNLLESAREQEISRASLLWGLGLLGFTSLYREGFEVVLFLQSYYLRLGGGIVLAGALLGLFFTGIVAGLTFVAHRKLPYRKMLILTGVMLGGVLLVMIGEQAQEMQMAHWISATPIPWLESILPDWMGLWFSVFPTVETLTSQLFAAGLVVGSYFLARHVTGSAAVCRDEASLILGHATGCPLAKVASTDQIPKKCPQCGMKLVRKK